jgi:hypothetical protein
MSETRATNPLVLQFRRGGVARDLRLMAAQGLLPLTPEDLLDLWTGLVTDADETIRTAAEKSLTEFVAAEFLPIVKNRATPVPVLAWAARRRAEPELREAALQNTSLPDEVIEELAPTLPQALAELVVINQTRLLRRTSLLVAIESNAGLNNDQKRRLRELRETFRVGEQPAEAPAAPSPAAAEAAAPAEGAPLAEAEPEIAPVGESFISEDEFIVRTLSDEDQKKTEKVSAVQKIYRLDVKDKLMTALKGTREERSILIRDPNRLVAAAVLGSPKMTDSEIEAISAMKNVSAEILRTIGSHREWTKKYTVLSNLVRNPRTPVGLALGMVPRLMPREIKSIAVDRNVPEPVRKQAQKFLKSQQPGQK